MSREERKGGVGATARPGAPAPLGAMALVGLLAALMWAVPVWGQVHVGGFTGAYHRGDGSHPFVYLAVGGRGGISVAGPLSVEVEALHVPAKIDARTVDLFAYRANLTFDFTIGDAHPFLLVGTGFQQWREWLCGGRSCGDPPGPGQKFEYTKGLGYTVGAGSRFHASGPLWFRVDARYENSRFVAPTNRDLMFTLGVELRP